MTFSKALDAFAGFVVILVAAVLLFGGSAFLTAVLWFISPWVCVGFWLFILCSARFISRLS